jgi:hypothetical protein
MARNQIAQSNIDAFLGVTAGIPAGITPEVGKQRMDTGFGPRFPEFVLGLSVLLMDGVKSVDRNLPELGPTARNLIAEGAVVAHINQQQQSQHRE